MRTASSLRVSILILLCATSALAQTATSRIVGAANRFLSSLEPQQGQSVLFAFDDEQQKTRWSNLPVPDGSSRWAQHGRTDCTATCRRAGSGFGRAEPAGKNPWMPQFGGHHLALNITIDGRGAYSLQPDGRATRSRRLQTAAIAADGTIASF